MISSTVLWKTQKVLRVFRLFPAAFKCTLTLFRFFKITNEIEELLSHNDLNQLFFFFSNKVADPNYNFC